MTLSTRYNDQNMELTLDYFQEKGVTHLSTPLPNGWPHKALGDDPGLGKTVVACEALKRVNAKSTLIICTDPTAVKMSWRWHLINWAGVNADKIYIVQNTKDSIPSDATHVIIGWALLNYPAVVRQVYHGCWWDVLIVDEAHRLKSTASKRSNTVLAGKSTSLASRCKWKWFLSGTLMPNRPIELFPILAAACPDLIKPYADYDAFGDRFCGGQAYAYRGATHTDDLKKRLGPFFLRRRLEDVYKDIPGWVEHDLYIDVGDLTDENGLVMDTSNTMLPVLRKAIGLAKLPYVIEYMKWVAKDQPGVKRLVFTYHREVSEALAREFNAPLYYGGLSKNVKDAALDKFMNDPACDWLIAQLNAAGESITDLQYVCNNILFAENDWSGGVFSQNLGRCLRRGQQDIVNVVNTLAVKTPDERITASRRYKRRLSVKLLDRENDEMTIEAKLDELISLQKEMLTICKGRVEAAPKSADTVPAGSTEKPADKKAATGKKEEPKAKKLTVEEVREAAKKARIAMTNRTGDDDASKAAIKAVVTAFGAESLDKLKEKDLPAALAEYNKLEAGEETPAEDDNDLGV